MALSETKMVDGFLYSSVALAPVACPYSPGLFRAFRPVLFCLRAIDRQRYKALLHLGKVNLRLRPGHAKIESIQVGNLAEFVYETFGFYDFVKPDSKPFRVRFPFRDSATGRICL